MSKEIRKKIQNFLDEREWTDSDPANTAKSISIEAAELLEHFQWKNHTADELKANPEKLEKVGKELADVLIYSHHMAHILGLDPDEIVEKKLEHAAKKYPVDKVRGGQGQDEYLKIKQDYRKKGIN